MASHDFHTFIRTARRTRDRATRVRLLREVRRDSTPPQRGGWRWKAGEGRWNGGCALHQDDASIPRAMEIGQRRRAPDAGLATLPGLRPLRRILMPRPRLEIAELLVDHLVELAEQFDDL